MKALVTGGTGFIGSHIADLLIERNIDVKCIVRKTSNLRWLENKNIELVEASLSNKHSLKNAMQDVDIVFHSAGLTSARNYEQYLKANLGGTQNLFEAAYEVNPKLSRFVHVSSQTAVGPSPSLDKPINENSEMNPITSYGRSKKEAELYLGTQKDVLPITIVRPPAVYGPRDEATLPVFKNVKYGFGTLIGFDYKYVSLINVMDLSSGIVEAGLSENTVGETYFISSEDFYNWHDIMDKMGAAVGKENIRKLKIPHFAVKSLGSISGFLGKFSKKPPVFNYEKSIDFIQKYWICSVDKAKSDFGYKQKYTLEEGFQKTINWYKEKGWF